ncbi:hypothetical protein [Leptospira licerasiae]|uniref:Invasion protein n=1 Tax=Leptospira licerasiae str. MMD4847 TaxID=1049971 RepID=A0ABN0HDH8_9LEPT|nr:hypothetical protein [Leptospira licerasiae]EIE01263.1 hypothetical protein LEP1GSC185_3684 [Leptospira licerasiae serovar Varillal str. VAR 010]EJZ43792.1 hypothetical protein LEP1GSC178_2212 [Leptospira licerasiae str. MMD4847]
MISYPVYKLIHILGILFLFSAYGGLALHVLGGGTKENAPKKLIASAHGIGMTLILLGGFGMLARIGLLTSFPGWVIAKIVIWLIFGGLLTAYYKKPEFAKILWFGLPVLGTFSAYLALYKPF